MSDSFHSTCPECGKTPIYPDRWLHDWCGNECHYTFDQCPFCGARFAALSGDVIRSARRTDPPAEEDA